VRGKNENILAIFELADDLEYTVLTENYNETGMKFISMYSVQNESIGMLLDGDSEYILGSWIQEAIDLSLTNGTVVTHILQSYSNLVYIQRILQKRK
jgi:hypothetical protein